MISYESSNSVVLTRGTGPTVGKGSQYMPYGSPPLQSG